MAPKVAKKMRFGAIIIYNGAESGDFFSRFGGGIIVRGNVLEFHAAKIRWQVMQSRFLPFRHCKKAL